MPIIDPKNDPECLNKVHDAARAFAATEQARNMASHLTNLEDVAEYIRALEHRDDLGDPNDGPRIQCDVPQRLRLPAFDPNCLERSAMFIAFASHVEPDVDVSTATVRVDNGLHTYPVIIRDGIPHPVELSSNVAHLRNAMTAAAYRIRNASPMNPSIIGPWFVDMTRQGCIDQGMGDCFDTAVSDIRNALTTGEPLQHVDDIENMLHIAQDNAQLFGAAGRVAYRRVHESIRNLSLGLNSKRVARFLNDLLDTAEPLAKDAVRTALIAKFGPAAQIALDGADIKIKDAKKPGNQSDRAEAPSTSPKKPTPEELRQRLRSMTFAFNQPPRKDT